MTNPNEAFNRVRECRTAAGLTQAELAERVSISAVSIRAFEKGGEMRDSNLKLIRMTFEAAGVTFIPENGGGAGVRLSKPKGSSE